MFLHLTSYIMAKNACHHLLSLGGAPRNHTLAWISEELIVYAGLSDICIVRKNKGTLIPEAILPILCESKAIFRSLRHVQRLDENSNSAFELICTCSDGMLLLVEIACEEENSNRRWSYKIVYKETVEPNAMVDAFAIRDEHSHLYIGVCTFDRFELRFRVQEAAKCEAADAAAASSTSAFITQTMRSLGNRVAISCIHVSAVRSNSGGSLLALLCVLGQTNKRLGVHIATKSRLTSCDSTFSPQFLDSKESIIDLDVRADPESCASSPFAFEILAATEGRAQIWKLYESRNTSSTLTNSSVAGFALESELTLAFDDCPRLLAHLSAYVLCSSTERLTCIRWDNSRPIFAIATRDNSIRAFTRDAAAQSALWTQKQDACSYGEPALELCGIYDVTFSPSSSSLLAHNTTGGFYFFSYDSELNFTPLSIHIGGHGGKVRALAWHADETLLTVGADKSTRLFNEYSNGAWGQRSRPQVHGHEIRCIASLDGMGFVSGAAEHMFRAFANRIPRLTIDEAIERIQPLNLTPKIEPTASNARGDEVEAAASDATHETAPVNEELLQSGAKAHEERRKLYAHGNECNCVAANPTSKFLFTSAKGSRPNESELVVWRTADWRLLQRCYDHKLTITAMCASTDGRFLLSVSRDRSLCVYTIDDKNDAAPLTRYVSMLEAHKRVIWSCAWLANTHCFATASRDGFVTLFELRNTAESETRLVKLQQWRVGECVSAIDFGECASGGAAVLVAGTESGNVHIVQVDVEARRLRIESVERLPQRQGFACASLIYCIRYNAKLQQFALCTERGVVMSFSL